MESFNAVLWLICIISASLAGLITLYRNNQPFNHARERNAFGFRELLIVIVVLTGLLAIATIPEIPYYKEEK